MTCKTYDLLVKVRPPSQSGKAERNGFRQAKRGVRLPPLVAILAFNRKSFSYAESQPSLFVGATFNECGGFLCYPV